MVQILLYIKHNLAFIWRFIEAANGLVFGWLHGKRLITALDQQLVATCNSDFLYRRLNMSDINTLVCFFENPAAGATDFFQTSCFRSNHIAPFGANPSFIMMGVFAGETLAGYFFLRCFVNKKCFIGRIVDLNFQRKGLAKSMSNIMYQGAWSSGFQCLTTISQKNKAIFDLHQKENNIRIIKSLPNDYFLVEMLPTEHTHVPNH